MKIIIYCLGLIVLVFSCNFEKSQSTILSGNLYPLENERIVSKEDAVYYIDPNSGNDKNPGTIKDEPWKTFKRVNQLQLTKGNKIVILSPGTFRESLFLIGKGTKESPIIVQFAPGKYDFYPQNAFKTKFHISNTNDAPDSLKSIAFYFLNSEHIKVKASNAEVIFRGKVIEICINNCNDVSIEGISFDYHRPTVSELVVLNENENFVDVGIHSDSKYIITDSSLIWIGEGWKHSPSTLWQVLNPETQIVQRINMPLSQLRFTEMGSYKVRIHFDKNPGFKKGCIYQNRNTFRDYAAVFMQRSKNISWKNVNVYFMHGMGFVSQFCENIIFDNLNVMPKQGSSRTCAAWADILHFSACKGKIEVTNSILSAANDDAINVHGTYMRIVNVISERKIKMRFMHNQTYGFNAFNIGDSVEFIRSKTLLPFSNNIVSKSKLLNKKEIELTFEQTLPEDIRPNDVIENSTYTADVNISNTKIMHIPTRGILINTRGKVVIKNNEFFKTRGSGVLIANDANSWFESGYVRDVLIKNNKFIECGSPVIKIHPENKEINEQNPVHENVQIRNNFFKINNNLLLSAKSTGNLKLINNTIQTNETVEVKDLLNFTACPDVEIKGNQITSINL